MHDHTRSSARMSLDTQMFEPMSVLMPMNAHEMSLVSGRGSTIKTRVRQFGLGNAFAGICVYHYFPNPGIPLVGANRRTRPAKFPTGKRTPLSQLLAFLLLVWFGSRVVPVDCSKLSGTNKCYVLFYMKTLR